MNKAQGILTLLEELFISKGRKLSDEMAKVWTKYLAEYDSDKIIYSIKREIMSSNQFPTLGALIESIDPKESFESDAEQSWSKLMKAMRDNTIAELPDGAKMVVNENFGGFYDIKNANDFQLTKMKKSYVKKVSQLLEENQKEESLKLINTKKDKQIE